jgi:hypothetical protein
MRYRRRSAARRLHRPEREVSPCTPRSVGSDSHCCGDGTRRRAASVGTPRRCLRGWASCPACRPSARLHLYPTVLGVNVRCGCVYALACVSLYKCVCMYRCVYMYALACVFMYGCMCVRTFGACAWDRARWGVPLSGELLLLPAASASRLCAAGVYFLRVSSCSFPQH